MEQEINLYDEIMSQQFVDWSGWQSLLFVGVCGFLVMEGSRDWAPKQKLI